MYSTKNAKRICFSPFLKVDKDGDFNKSNGSEFHSFEGHTEGALSPSCPQQCYDFKPSKQATLSPVASILLPK